MDQPSLSEVEQQRFVHALLQHLDALYSFAWWLSHRREESEELVQETCLRALCSAHQFQDGTNLKAWLFSILKHEWPLIYSLISDLGDADLSRLAEKLRHK